MEGSNKGAAKAKKVELLSTLIVLIGRAFSVVLVMAFLLTLLLSKLHGHFCFMNRKTFLSAVLTTIPMNFAFRYDI